MTNRKWTGGSTREFVEKMGLGIGYVAGAHAGRCNIKLPSDHWTYRVEGKAKPVKYSPGRDEDEADLDIELDQLEQYEAYQAEANDVEELFK